MEPWRRILREGLLRALTEDELHALRKGVAADDAALIQGLMTLPPPLEILGDWEVEATDLTAYPAWRARGLKTVGEVEEAAWTLCQNIDARMGEGAAKELLAWYDTTARADMMRTLSGEAEMEIMFRMLRRAAETAGQTA